MDTFSLYSTVLRAARSTTVPLRALGDTTLTGHEGALDPVTFDTRMHSMQLWCRITEKLLVERRLRDADVFAGFERFSRVRPVLARYRQIASFARSLTVFGDDDATLQVPGMRTVALDEGPLRNEWFLVVSSSSFRGVIVSEDLDGFGGGVAIAARRFRGFASHHRELVEVAASALVERYATAARA